MSFTGYFLNIDNWSVTGLLAVIVLFVSYSILFDTRKLQKLAFGLSLILIYLALGSPLAKLTSFGLHSIVMLQHIVLLMIIPVLLLKALPNILLQSTWYVSVLSKVQNIYLLLWLLGAVAMWGGHFFSAALLSAKTGTAICGINATAGSWVTAVPSGLSYTLLVIAGLLFYLPVFNPVDSGRLAPLKRVVYLFTACVSCSTLGLYVVFSATSAAAVEAIPIFNTLRNPLPMSLRSDQELAGMLMWVPGCILYVMESVNILLKWYDGETAEEPKVAAVKISKD